MTVEGREGGYSTLYICGHSKNSCITFSFGEPTTSPIMFLAPEQPAHAISLSLSTPSENMIGPREKRWYGNRIQTYNVLTSEATTA